MKYWKYLPAALLGRVRYLWRTRHQRPFNVSREEYYRTLDGYYAESDRLKNVADTPVLASDGWSHIDGTACTGQVILHGNEWGICVEHDRRVTSL